MTFRSLGIALPVLVAFVGFGVWIGNHNDAQAQAVTRQEFLQYISTTERQHLRDSLLADYRYADIMRALSAIQTYQLRDVCRRSPLDCAK